MKDYSSINDQQNPFVSRMETHISQNLDNEQFGVVQLAELMNISRSQLHRKLHKISGKSISQFIREYRLERAFELLVNGEFNTSEIADKVGFGSASYFSKCFTEYFGYPPSKTKDKLERGIVSLNEPLRQSTKKKALSKNYQLTILLGSVMVALVSVFFIFKGNKATTVEKSKTVLVMPFKNLSDSESNQHIADGMVDAITRHLSTIEELDILSNMALDVSKEDNEAIKEFGANQPNANVLYGSVQKDKNMLRIEVKLVNVSNSKQLWAENYDRKSGNLLEIQNDIAKSIATTLEAQLTPKELAIMDKRTSYDPEAYDNFLKGWYYHNLHSAEGHEKSFIYFKEALKIDSTLARAHLGIALYYMSKAAMWRSELPPSEAFNLSSPFLDKALELDPQLYEGYAVKSFELIYDKWDFEGAEKNFEKGLKSTEPVFFGLYRDFLNVEHRHDEAFKMAEKVNDKYPYMPNAIMAKPFYYTNRWEEGREYVDYQLKLGYKTNFTLEGIGFFLLNTEDYNRAIEIFKTALESEKTRIPRTLGYMGAAYAKKGDNAMAGQLLTELKELKTKTDAGSPAWCSAIIHSALGEKKKALKWLTIAVSDHEMEVPWLVSEPQFYPLHGHPEFDELVKRVGFRKHAYPIKK